MFWPYTHTRIMLWLKYFLVDVFYVEIIFSFFIIKSNKVQFNISLVAPMSNTCFFIHLHTKSMIKFNLTFIKYPFTYLKGIKKKTVDPKVFFLVNAKKKRFGFILLNSVHVINWVDYDLAFLNCLMSIMWFVLASSFILYFVSKFALNYSFGKIKLSVIKNI